MNNDTNSTGRAGLLAAQIENNAEACDQSLAALEALIAEQLIRFTADDVLWTRVGEISDQIMGRLPFVRVQTGKMLVGRDHAGTELFDPLYAYTDEQIDENLEPHYQATLSIRGDREDLRAALHKNFTAHKDKLKAELAALHEEHKAVQDQCGYTLALDAARASAASLRDLEARILNFIPQTLAAAVRQAQWAVWACDANSYVEFEDTIKVLTAIAAAGLPANCGEAK